MNTLRFVALTCVALALVGCTPGAGNYSFTSPYGSGNFSVPAPTPPVTGFEK